MVTTSTFVADSVKFIRDDLLENIEDPIVTSRASNEKFVMTSYPERPVRYPIITVKTTNIADVRRLGMRSELHFVNIPIEIRIWATNVKQRDDLFQQVYNRLRDNQFGGTDSSSDDNELHDFFLRNSFDIDEDGKTGIKSKILEVEYKTIVGG